MTVAHWVTSRPNQTNQLIYRQMTLKPNTDHSIQRAQWTALKACPIAADVGILILSWSLQNANSYLVVPSDHIHSEPASNASFWATLNTRSKYYLPILQWLPLYTRQDFSQDILSGLSLSALFIPQALSYATALCRIPAIHGLYTVSVTTFVYACLGMSP